MPGRFITAHQDANEKAVIELDADGTLAANSDEKIATQKGVKTYVDESVAGATGSFVAQSGETITVENGLITEITAP